MRELSSLAENWGKNHRWQGGLPAAARCLAGQRSLASGRARAGLPAAAAELEVLTFSVVPWMTALWAKLLGRAFGSGGHRLLIGDASGGFGLRQRRLLGPGGAAVLPCLNFHHGEKLDLFLTEVCRSELVLICDDDVFWLDDSAWTWARDEMRRDAGVAVVSLLPRTRVSSVLAGEVAEPMGSSCLLVRRELWLREKLSFRVAPPPDPATMDWFYDTADLANVLLLRRGFKVVIAPPAVRRGLAPLEAISAWVLKVQKHGAAGLAAAAADLPLRQEKALRALLTARGLARLLGKLEGEAVRLLPEPLLAASLAALAGVMAAAEHAAIEAEVEGTLGRLATALALVDEGPGGEHV